MMTSECNSIFSSLVYQAIGEPEYWNQNTVEALVKLLTSEYGLDGPESLTQIRLGRELVGELSEKESLVSAVMTVLDGARYGLLVIGHDYKVLYQNKKAKPYLKFLLDPRKQSLICKPLRDLIAEAMSRVDSDEGSELVRLDYNSGGRANIYLKSTVQENSNFSTPQYLHHMVVAGADENSDQISDQVAKAYGLSEREVSIVQSAVRALASGSSTKEIAQDLFISPNTVKTHLKSIYAKSGVNSLAALVSLYLQHEVQQLAAYFGTNSYMESVDGRSRSQMVTLSDGQTICYRDYGNPEGRPLVVMHNSYSSRLNLPPNGDEIARRAGRRVIIPDRPGYGRSPANEHYPEKWCGQLADFADQLGLEKFDLLGTALSVRYVIEFADQYPNRLSKMILAAPLLITNDQSEVHFSEWMKVSIKWYERNAEIATEIYKLWHSSASLRLDRHIEKNLEITISNSERGLMDSDEFITVLKNNFKESAAQQGRGCAADFQYTFNKSTVDLSQITTQAEIWVGSEDGLYSAEGVRETFEALPNKVIFEKEGYGEHIYYSLFNEIIA